MISADTSSFVDYLKGGPYPGVALVRQAVRDETLILPPVVISELLSSPKMTPEIERTVTSLPRMEMIPGFWERVGKNRAVILRAGLKAKLADSMIATFCLDHNMPLIARDGDYRHFAEHSGLELMEG